MKKITKESVKGIKPFKPTKKHIREKLHQAVNILNEMVKIKVAPSPIHGVGVFAMRDIKKGEKLYSDVIPNAFDLPYAMFKKLRPEVSEFLLSRWPLIVNGSRFLYPDTKLAAFINFSPTPNYDCQKDVMLEDVKKGEEIFEDYTVIPNYDKVYPWLVKEKNKDEKK